MTAQSDQQNTLAQTLLSTHGRTFCGELGIDIARNTPSPLFRWLCASILLSARIRSDIALAAAHALSNNGWTTAEKMAESRWEDRTRTLNCAGYARYDESTSTMLEQSAAMLLETYGGDLRVLRERADYDPATERKLLKEFKGLGDVGADIFLREAQVVWDEHHPFADKKAVKAASKLGLAETPAGLAKLVRKSDYTRLLAALVRTDLEHDYDEVREQVAA